MIRKVIIFMASFIFTPTLHCSENRVTMSYSEGPAFYTTGDYKIWSQTQTISWMTGSGFGVELNRYRFEYNHDGGNNFMVFKLDEVGYDFSLLKNWNLGSYFSLGTSGGFSFLIGKTEETAYNFWATPAEYSYLELKLYRFNTSNYDSLELGRNGYRFHVFPPEPNGTAHVTVTELRNRKFYGITASLSPTLNYKNLRLFVLPGFHWYPEIIIYRIAVGLGLVVNL